MGKVVIIINSLFKTLPVFMLSIFLILSGLAYGKGKPKKKKPEFALELGLGGSYDDNILKYSDKYLKRFMNREDKGRFHIDTYDDFIVYTSGELTGTFYIFGKNKTLVNAGVSRRTYVVNRIKNWDYYTVGIRQYTPGRISFKFLYSYIPDFYVRHFRDDEWIDVYGYEPITFTPYAFSKDNYGFYIQKYFFKNSRIRFSLYYAEYYHNKHYTEYDSKNWYYRFQVFQYLFENLRLDVGYEYVTSDAKGYDASVETPETTDGPDATYAEDVFEVSLQWKPPRIKGHYNVMSVGAEWLNRYYSTSHPVEIDQLHAGRVDKNFRISLDYRVKLSRSVDIQAFYNYYFRDTETTSEINSEYVSNEKDYKQNIYGIELNYTIDLQ